MGQNVVESEVKTQELKVNDQTNGLDMVDATQIVTFFIGREEYGFDIGLVQEIISPLRITKVPHSKRFINGVINLRGKIIPIFDLKERLTGQPAQIDDDSKIIVVHTDQFNIGLLVTRVNEVVMIPKSSFIHASDKLNDRSDNYLECIANLEKRLISIIDLEKVLEQ